MEHIPVYTYADGTIIPRLGQGTWYLGEKRSARREELAALRTGIECGLTLIDTAEMYGEGLSEKLVGEAIAPYAHHIHVFQWKDKQRFSLNDGIGEWRGYLEKFSTPRTLLLEFMPDNAISSLAAEAEALRAIVKK